jgi:hypothetical protein
MRPPSKWMVSFADSPSATCRAPTTTATRRKTTRSMWCRYLGRKRGLANRPSGDRHVREPEQRLQAVELLLEQTPDLLPGQDTGLVTVVRQLYVPLTGPVDLFAVSIDGDLTVVECKLKANSEIRRWVVGQVLAYAAGLWRLPFEELDAAFIARAGEPVSAKIGALAREAGGDFDEEPFRRTVSATLAAGRFRLVIAVDAITDELKRIVEYLDDHTVADVEVLALELGYAADGDVELLIPAVYGADRLRPLPGVATLYEDLVQRGYNKRPSIPVNKLFSATDAVERITAAVDELTSVNGPTESKQSGPARDDGPAGD